MPKRQVGKPKLTPRVRQRLVKIAKETRELVYGTAACPEWGTSFAELEDDGKEVGHEFIRLFVEQGAGQQAEGVPDTAFQTAEGERAQLIGEVPRTIETESGRVSWREPEAYLPKSRRVFFPRAKALGLEVDQDLSPALQRKVVHLATKLPSFPSARESIEQTLEITLTSKRVERLTERIGQERVTQREEEIDEWEQLPAVEKSGVPAGVSAPEVVSVSCDGGRLQRCDLPEDAKSHWCESKVGILLELEPRLHNTDPRPQVPEKFLDLGRVDKLAGEIKGGAPKGRQFQRFSDKVPRSRAASAKRRNPVSRAPVVISREVVASLADSTTFGKQLAARAWLLGFAVALRKGFVADGQSSNWGIWERHFKDLGFVPIVDFIHALTYVYAAAMAGRPTAQGWPTYVRWITWVWEGQVKRAIKELAVRKAELGPSSDAASETDPRRIVADALTYLRNQQSRMNYPEYRRLGLPIVSSHVESAVKQVSQRVKGSEKFWSRRGGEALLQLRADQLSDSRPLDRFWRERPSEATGTRYYRMAA